MLELGFERVAPTMSWMTRALQRIAGRSALALLGVLGALALTEVGYRVVRSSALSPTTNPAYVRPDAELGWSYAPNARERHRSSEFDVEITINSAGFRGREWPLANPKTKPRVLVLGDSLAFGWGVEDNETFSARLQALEPGWDVLDAAVSGYGTDQEALLLDRLAGSVVPDVVVCVFCGNDLFENASSIVYGRPKPVFRREEGLLVLRGVPVVEPWLERWSRVFRAWKKSRSEAELARRDADPTAEWTLVCDLYRRMARRLGDVPLVLVSQEARLEALAREEKTMRHLDLRPVFEHEQGAVTFPIDGHWTALAHAKVAAALREKLTTVMR